VLWSHSAQGPVSDLFALQDDLTQGIVQALALPLTAREQKMLRHDVPSTPRAYAHYLRANEVSRETGQWRVARDLYLDCIDEDPRYAPAWAALGRLHRLIAKYHEGSAPEGYARAELALKRALELNPDLSVAENVYAHLEVDLGRASEAMVRLIRLAGTRSAEPELFAGLVHACRYCGLLRASIAAFERAQRLDPGIRASIAHTWFMLGDYERAIGGDNEAIPYMRNAALIMMGRQEEALASLRAIDERMPGLLISFTSSLRHLLEGNIEDSRAALQPIMAAKDPEARFYLARQLSHIGDTSGAVGVLRGVVNDGFFCLPAMVRDPWLDPLRALPEFNEILTLAEGRHRAAIVSFLTSGGDRVLGVNHPAQ
jgi:tetratricopeptide (TPR) repeat protein